MMGGETPETCWATYKRQVINLWKCCILLVELFELHFTTLHSSFFTSQPFWTFRHHPSKTLPLFTYNYFPNPLSKNMWFTGGKSPSPLKAVGSTVWLSCLQSTSDRCLFCVSWPTFDDRVAVYRYFRIRSRGDTGWAVTVWTSDGPWGERWWSCAAGPRF